jgi:methyltransferase-like protein/predicted O-methyltransferase YrrM
MATIARMFGLAAPDIASCRVLEIGCASGGNLIPMAFNLPGSDFVGIDLARHQVSDANATIQALGLRNIRIEHASVDDVDRGWGEFDYIICHGVFSWVDAHVQDRILQVASDNLRENGISYVSYNTYPGWHMRGMVRDMMRYHVEQFDEPAEKVQQARALLAFLGSAADSAGVYGQFLHTETERLGRASDAYLYHEHLEPTNAPMYFHEFVERAERAGLLYLAEASVSEMLAAQFPAHVSQTLERISPDILHLEQYMDFIRNRQFRQTLLCRHGSRPNRSLTPSFLDGLLVSSKAVGEGPIDLSPGKKAVFWNGRQRADAVLPASKAAFAIVTEAWPEAVSVADVCAAALERAAPFLASTPIEDARRALMGDLLGGVMYGMVRLHTRSPGCTRDVADVPRAHPLAAYQATLGRIVVNAHHEIVQLEAIEHAVLQRCDRVRNRDEIAADVVARVERGDIIPNGGDAGAEQTATIDEVFERLRRHALLVQ